MLVGPWARLRTDPVAGLIGRGPAESGVFAEFAPDPGGGESLHALDQHGDDAGALGPDAGLLAATRRYEGAPVWVVTGTSPAGVLAAATLLNAADLRDRYAVAIEGGDVQPLPVTAG